MQCIRSGHTPPIMSTHTAEMPLKMRQQLPNHHHYLVAHLAYESSSTSIATAITVYCFPGDSMIRWTTVMKHHNSKLWQSTKIEDVASTNFIEGFVIATLRLWESPLFMQLTKAISQPVVTIRSSQSPLSQVKFFGLRNHPGLCNSVS